MLNDKRILSVILARKNSKGLPDKNIRKLNGSPLLSWPINASIRSKYIDTTVLSTDSIEYADIGRSFGALTPFLRPDYLADDKSLSCDAVIHAINFFHDKNDTYDYVLLLEPTSPLTETSDIDLALEILLDNEKNSSSLVSISEVVSSHPSYCFKLNSDNFLIPFEPKNNNIEMFRRQDLDKLYYCDGSLYISKIDDLIKRKSFYHDQTISYKVPEWKSFEIDTEFDFFLVEQIMNKYLKSQYEKK